MIRCHEIHNAAQDFCVSAVLSLPGIRCGWRKEEVMCRDLDLEFRHQSALCRPLFSQPVGIERRGQSILGLPRMADYFTIVRPTADGLGAINFATRPG